MPDEQDAHDRVAYPAYSYPATHPDTLAVMGMLHGLDAAPVDRCRVLEVGCNEGANLIPMAYALPNSEFVGFDRAALPVARAQQRIAELGLANIRIFQADLLDVGATLGLFDYIIAHGVYTWVGEQVRERLLTLCQQHLSPNGIAFVSYNALPGGHFKNMLRDILLQGMRGVEDPVAGVRQGFQFLRLLVGSRPQDDPYRSLLEKELHRLEKRGPYAVFHDELSRDHQPVSFNGFMERATAHGLQYVSEATLPPTGDLSYKPAFTTPAASLAAGDAIAQEQILDFGRIRMYRETLLCHAERPLSSDLTVENLNRLFLSSPVNSTEGEGAILRVYTLPSGIRMESAHAGTVTLMDILIEAWPGSVPFPKVVQHLAEQGIELDADLFRLLFQLVVSRMIDLHAWQAPVSHVVESHPLASGTARQEAKSSRQVTTFLHSSLLLEDELVHQLLLLLDGTRDRAALLESLSVLHPELDESSLSAGLEASLRLLNRAGVLQASSAN